MVRSVRRRLFLLLIPVALISFAMGATIVTLNLSDSVRIVDDLDIAKKAPPPPACGPAVFGPTVNLRNGDSINHQIAASGSNVYVVWQDISPGNPDIFFRRSSDDGSSFRTTRNLSANRGSSLDPQIAVSSSNVYVVWEDSTPGNPDIFFRRSSDGGSSFKTVVNLSNNVGTSSKPQVAVSGSRVYVVWEDDTPGNSDIFFRRSSDGGSSFGPTINLSENAGLSRASLVAVFGSNVYVVWEDDSLGVVEVFFRRSPNGGSSFDPMINLSNNPGDSMDPQMAVSGSNVHVVWRDATLGNFDILFARSTNNGTSFGGPVNLSTAFPEDSESPHVAASSSNVYIVWEHNTFGNNEIFFRRSTNSGSSFESIVNLSLGNTDDSETPRVAASSSNVYVAWRDLTPGNYDILFRRSTNDGSSFGSTINLSSNAGGSFEPRIAVSGSSRVYVVWDDETPGKSDIFFRRSSDGGSSFRSTVNLSSNTGSALNPQIAVSGSTVYVVWQDKTPGNSDILFKRSTDNGMTFGDTVNLSGNKGDSSDARVAISGNNVYVLWEDTTPGTDDIFFRRSTDAGATFDSAINLSTNSGLSTRPRFDISGTDVYVVWEDDTTGGSDVYFRRSTNGGATFDPIINLSNNSAGSHEPRISAGSNIYVVWEDSGTGNSDILFRRSSNSGASFDATINLSANSGSSRDPQVDASSSNVYVAWHDSSPGNSEILFRRSTDSGASFDSSVNLSNNLGTSQHAQLAVAGASLYLVWEDTTTGSGDIYLRRSASAGAAFEATANLSANSGSSTDPRVIVSGSDVYVVWEDRSPGNKEVLFRQSGDGAANFGTAMNLSSNSGSSNDPRIAVSGCKVYVVWQDTTKNLEGILFKRT